MSSAKAAWRLLILLVLTVATLGFSLIGLCGATFTAIGLASLWMGTSTSPLNSIQGISLFSLLVGGALAWICGVLLARHLNDDGR